MSYSIGPSINMKGKKRRRKLNLSPLNEVHHVSCWVRVFVVYPLKNVEAITLKGHLPEAAINSRLSRQVESTSLRR
jgi:hypothetical protein